MTLIKDGWALALVVLSLLFLPQEKLDFWFADRPQDWYGELTIPGAARDYVLVKNRSPYSVHLRADSTRVLGAASLEGVAVDLGGERSVALPRDTFILFTEERPATPQQRRRSFAESVSDFSPPPLYVTTEAEDDVSIMLLFLGAALMACLGFSIGLFFHESAAPAESNPASR